MLRRYSGNVLRLITLVAVWMTAFALFHFMSMGRYADGRTDELGIVFFGIAIVIGTVFVSERVLGLRINLSRSTSAPVQHKTAAIEPETLRLRDMMALLDEDDLDDLRAEVREGLRDRIRNLTADESESFDDLLADAGPKRKRGAR